MYITVYHIMDVLGPFLVTVHSLPATFLQVSIGFPWKINPINAGMIENDDFEKFPNQKWYLGWLKIKNQTQKWF